MKRVARGQTYRSVRVEVATHVLNLEFQLLLRALGSALIVCQYLRMF